MKKFLNYIAVLSIVLLASFTIFADAPAPSKVVKSMRSGMKIQVATDDKTKEARLVIPQREWSKFRAEIEGGDNTNIASRFGMSRTQTIMTGLFLSLAFAFGGVWIVRNRGAIKNKVVIGIIVFALCGAVVTTISFANIPPPQVTSLNDTLLSEAARQDGVSGTIRIEVVDGYDYDTITLILPKRASK